MVTRCPLLETIPIVPYVIGLRCFAVASLCNASGLIILMCVDCFFCTYVYMELMGNSYSSC